MTSSAPPAWNKKLQERLAKKVSLKKAKQLIETFAHTFPSYYHEEYTLDEVIADILTLDEMTPTDAIKVKFYQSSEKEGNSLHLKLFQPERAIALSDVLPLLENMDLRTLTERSSQITLNKAHSLWISDFVVIPNQPKQYDLAKISDLFQQTFTQIQLGLCENDGFNKLILRAGLSWRETSILRAYAKYLQQIGFRFSQLYIEKTLTLHAAITPALLKLFYLKHDPRVTTRNEKAIAATNTVIQHYIEAVTSLDEDRILRQFWQLIQATLRTNYFQTLLDQDTFKNYLSFKLRSSEVPELPLPHPLYEIFVYSPRFEGIHLRAEKIARGGIRWSERPEDFRTEILGLMKAQKVKNSIIIPSGAKGGFVLKKIRADIDRKTLQQETIICYELFIKGLLDITDNLQHDKVIRPKQVVCYDDQDPYLVVAADKGTAAFSDTANRIAKEYGFWLGDAFASGGSAGYDHKKMGITAKGVWESIKRHCRELSLDIKKHDITTVGIGDMSGDVFGNGMLYTNRIKLIAAFDHRSIFLDPNPEPHTAFIERKRLFKLAGSSWDDYNRNLISTGGGVFKRSEKFIKLTPEIKSALHIQDPALTPNELIRAILKAPVDLLFNGGIGTYVKASYETHAEVSDRTNEFCRINGNELRCKMVAEGGNLGCTQLGRIEYALNKGLINTDFIDNSAGVDCSDHEVNIKILLNQEVTDKKLTETARNQLLKSMTNEVANLVLQDNYNQALAISFSSMHPERYSNLYQDYIKELESSIQLNCAVEFLPDDKKLAERKTAGQGLTRPELAVLLAYTKIHIKNEILKSNLPEDPYFISLLETAFPATLIKKYKKTLTTHRLRREIIATQLSNTMVNSAGITFVYRLQTETGASIADIARAYTIASNAYRTADLQKLIDSLDKKISIQLQFESLHYVRQLLHLSTRWFLHASRFKNDIASTVHHYSSSIQLLSKVVPTLMVGITKAYMKSVIGQFATAGMEQKIAKNITISRAMYTALNITEIATQHRFELIRTAKIYFDIGTTFNLVWFRDQINNDPREGHWNSNARLTLRDELDALQRRLATIILQEYKQEPDAKKLISLWTLHNKPICDRWEKLSAMVRNSPSLDYTVFFIAIRELSNLTYVEEAV